MELRSAENDKKYLESIQASCIHEYPEEWDEKVGNDYRWMGGAVDPIFRQNKPEIIAVKFKLCKICGKEKREN